MVVEVLASEARLLKEWHFGWYASFVGFDFVAEPISGCHYANHGDCRSCYKLIWSRCPCPWLQYLAFLDPDFDLYSGKN